MNRAASLLALLSAPAAAAPPDASVAARVERVLSRQPVIDGHNDLPWELRERFGGRMDAIDLSRDTAALPPARPGQPPLMTDIQRARAGRLGAQFWSVWIPTDTTGPAAVETTIEQIDLVHRMVAHYPRDMAMAGTAADIVRIERSGRIAALIGVEGGHQIDDRLAALRAYHALGVRYMTLSHSRNNDFADSATDAPRHHGLTPFGKAVVGEMNRLGMLVDLSHVSADVMRQALAIAKAPVIFSHSSARALADHPRDVPDDVLALVRANRGVVMANFYPVFVLEARRRWEAARDAEAARRKSLLPGDPDAAKAAVAAWEKANPMPRATVADVADHIEHIVGVCGHGCVGIGSDFDGVPDVPDGLSDVSRYPALFAELARRGWSDAELAALSGGNLLRVLGEAEAVSRRLAATPADERTIAELDRAS